MTGCSACNCQNRPSHQIKGITFHLFPANARVRQQWILAVRRANWTPSKSSRLCSEHFEERMFDRASTIRTKLKKTAVPTIFKGYPPIPDLDFLKPQFVEPFEDISNNNRIIIAPVGLDVQATFNSRNGYSVDDKNVVIINNEQDCKALLNCDSDGDNDADRTIIVSDGTSIKTESGDNDEELSDEPPTYDPDYGEESCKADIVNHSKLRSLMMFDPDFYVRKIKNMCEKMKKFRLKKKGLHQTSRRRKRKIAKLQKEVYRLRKNIAAPKCTTHPIVHVIPQVNN